MRVQLLLDQRENSRGKGQLEKAAALVDIMSSALSLVEQNNETDHINILKVSYYFLDVLFLYFYYISAKGLLEYLTV